MNESLESPAVLFDGSAREFIGGGVEDLVEHVLAEVRRLAGTYRFVTAETWFDRADLEPGLALVCLEGGRPEHAQHVAPALEELGIPCLVAIPARALSDEPDRWALGDLILTLATRLAGTAMESALRAVCARCKLAESPHPECLTRTLLASLSGVGTRQRRHAEERLRALARWLDLDADEHYMTREDALTLQRAGHSVGALGYERLPLDDMPELARSADLHRAQETLGRALGNLPRALVTPFGGGSEQTHTSVFGSGFAHCLDGSARLRSLRLAPDRRDSDLCAVSADALPDDPDE